MQCGWLKVAALWAVGALLQPAGAESLRCAGGSVTEGDLRITLMDRCGAPRLSDAYCAPVAGPGFQPVPPWLGSFVAPCVVTEEWLYDRGPGNLPVTVRLRAGQVQSIHYGRSSR